MSNKVNDYNDFDESAHEAYWNRMFYEDSPTFRATKMFEELEKLVLMDPKDYPATKTNNSFGISPQGYKLAYSICGFLCTQVIDLHKKGAQSKIVNDLGWTIVNHSREILDYIEKIIKNSLSAIEEKEHQMMKPILRGFEAELHRQGQTQTSFIFRESIREFFGKLYAGNSSACYIATYAFDSYDAPQVIALRKFRDTKLENNKLGKRFIRIYYFLSQEVLIRLGRYKWFNSVSRVFLSRFIKILMPFE